MKSLLQLLLAQKLISNKCVLFKNNLLQGDTAPLNVYGTSNQGWIYFEHRLFVDQETVIKDISFFGNIFLFLN